MDKYFQSYTPRVKVVKRDLISNDESYSLLSDEIISITTNKAYGRCSGTWQMILPYYSRWYVDNDGKPIIWSNVLEPDHLLIIEMDAGDGSGLKNVMYGLIDRVSTVRQGGIQPQRTVKISGRDLGKLMEKYDVTYDALKIQEEFVKKQDSSPPQKEQTRVRILDPKLMIGTSDEIIGHAFAYFWENMDYGHRFSFVSDTDDTWKILQPNMVQQLHTSFWQYISQADNRPYNMLHNDVDPDVQGQQLLVLEKNPLDDKGELTRDADRSAAIDDTEIISDDLGISDAERVNLLARYKIYLPQIDS